MLKLLKLQLLSVVCSGTIEWCKIFSIHGRVSVS